VLQAIIGDFHVAAVTHFEPLGANPFCSFGAPDAERPFATAYYPAAENESEAAVVKVVRSSPLRLSPLRLRKLEVVTIKINVLWADGTRPERSNLYFKNILYPRGVGTLPQIDNGVIPFDSPADVTYGRVRAQLERVGKPIGGNDLLIAAHALTLGYTLVSDNTREFAQVRGLQRENWLRPS
jgi:hypothetical protein